MILRVLILLCLPTLAIADSWVWFNLCKHSTGETVEDFKFEGIHTQGRMFRSTNDIHGVIPLNHDKCVILDLKDGAVVVQGSLKEVWCKIRQGPGCESE